MSPLPNIPSDAYPNNPNGDLVPILEASVEAAKERHPSGKDDTFTAAQPALGLPDVITHADRCDNDCSAAALYRLQLREMTLEFCHHHYGKHFPEMRTSGWTVTGKNGSLHTELYGAAS